jgi:hypothetical protein
MSASFGARFSYDRFDRLENDLFCSRLRFEMKTMEKKEMELKDGGRKKYDRSFYECLHKKYAQLNSVPKDVGVTKAVISKGPIFF